LGGNIRKIIVGSAPSSKQVLDFIKIAVCCPVTEGYGLTETCAASFSVHKMDTEVGHVGGPSFNSEYCLMDVKEMNYTSEDLDEDGQYAPRGEICIRGP